MPENTIQSSPEELRSMQRKMLKLNFLILIPSIVALLFGILEFSSFCYLVLFAAIASTISLYMIAKMRHDKAFHRMSDSEKISTYKRASDFVVSMTIGFFLMPLFVDVADPSFIALAINTLLAIAYHQFVDRIANR